MDSRPIIFGGTPHPELLESICYELTGIYTKGKATLKSFNNNELSVTIDERNLSGRDVFIVQACGKPSHGLSPNSAFMQICLMADAVRRSDAGRITAVIPYFPYQRQEKKTRSGVPIAAKFAMDVMIAAGFTRIITVDLHAEAIQGFANIAVENLYASFALVPAIEELIPSYERSRIVIATTDMGAARMARGYAKILGVNDIALIDKRRPAPGQSEVEHVVGDVNDKICIIVDDMVDTAGSLVKAAEAYIKKGARKIYAACAHLVLSKNAIQRIEDSPIEKIIGLDTLPITEEERECKKLIVVPCGKFLGQVIQCTHERKSLTKFFLED